MRTTLLTLLLSLTVLTGLRAQDLSADDRAAGLAYLEKTRAGVYAAAAGLSEAQLTFKAAPDKWSVAQVLEHIASAEDMLLGMVTEQALKAPPRSDGEDVKAIDALILTAIPDRSQKRSAPEPLIPSNRYGSSAEALKHFGESRTKTLALMADVPDLRGHAMDSPLGKKLDPYQWLLFISAHTERHTKQMLEVKADPGFPKQ
ncbi:DinB superfamily protein [Lacunisphaera limnophila]|uniref:DinB superfamily protein n=1 Tax=Lacunisphaera limnophila TaxID=1838286 RepID=A0A1D8ARS0_9BACT|nr:DinB family protein [Lacunisphaera limnophila]AOS43576.1 DinB superfamily protein [Lacunisphaera limnophila]